MKEIDFRKSLNYVSTIEATITKLQDGDGHWYWIPNELISSFHVHLNEIIGKEYVDFPDEYDFFAKIFNDYLTGGDRDIMPDYFIPKA